MFSMRIGIFPFGTTTSGDWGGKVPSLVNGSIPTSCAPAQSVVCLPVNPNSIRRKSHHSPGEYAVGESLRTRRMVVKVTSFLLGFTPIRVLLQLHHIVPSFKAGEGHLCAFESEATASIQASYRLPTSSPTRKTEETRKMVCKWCVVVFSFVLH